MEKLLEVVRFINNDILGIVLIPLLLGVGLYYTFRLGFIQKLVFKAFKQVFGDAFKGGKADEDGMSSFQALATAIAAQVGTGNLAGVATALIAGGPGAIFWMWVSAILGMATNYGEAVLGQLYRTKVDGEITGGPAYYIRDGVKNKYLAGFFAIAIILALGFMGNMVQANSISHVTKAVVDINPIIIGVIVAIIVGIILSGGIASIASFTEKVVPVMALIYIVGGVVVIIMNRSELIPAFRSIFVGAFNPRAVGGGIAGITVLKTIRYGISRGLFSNEAGMGSTPHAHAVAKVKHPGEQGLVALVGVTVDTLIICTMTALVILTTGVLDTGIDGAELTQKAFEVTFGHGGTVFVAVALFFFALTTIVGWYYFGENNIKYLFGKKGVPIYKGIVLICIVVGSTLQVNLVWELADMFNFLMVFPNVIALFILAPKVTKSLDEYYELEGLGKYKVK